MISPMSNTPQPFCSSQITIEDIAFNIGLLPRTILQHRQAKLRFRSFQESLATPRGGHQPISIGNPIIGDFCHYAGTRRFALAAPLSLLTVCETDVSDSMK